ncbi:hypothetical protein MMC30_004321 [Trapelia coarctata]|nr:hypothetical protein [Trapelia coarctata]
MSHPLSDLDSANVGKYLRGPPKADVESQPSSAEETVKHQTDRNDNINGEIDNELLDKEFGVCWDGENDLGSPHSMSLTRKWVLVLLVSSTTLCTCCTSSLYTSTYEQITVEFKCSELVATIGLSLFIGGLGLGPMLLAPLSEFYGRRPIYIVSLFLFVVLLVPCALAPNIQTMLVARFLNGLAGAAFSSVAGGTVGDLFTKHTLQAPMLIYTASPL